MRCRPCPAPWRRLCLIALGAALTLAIAAQAPAFQPAKPVTEVVERPFPLIMPLSYRWARGAAWMGALMAACPDLPQAARRDLAPLGLDDRAGRLALCARAYTLDHLTSPDSPDMAVAVRLVPAPAGGAGPGEELLAVGRALLEDMERTLLAVGRDWPANLAEARKRAVALEAASLRLEALWQALEATEPEGPWCAGAKALPVLERAAHDAPDIAALWLLLAEARLQRDLPQGAVAAAAEALRLAGAGNGAPAEERLAARARYVRGLAHWRLGQPALAEADLAASLSPDVEGAAPQGAELARRLRSRGAVRMARRDVAGMCEDFAAACALGDCEGLAAARSHGHCRAAPEASGGKPEPNAGGTP